MTPVRITEAAYPSGGGGTARRREAPPGAPPKCSKRKPSCWPPNRRSTPINDKRRLTSPTAVTACESTTTPGPSVASKAPTDTTSTPATTPDSNRRSGSAPGLGLGSGSGGSGGSAVGDEHRMHAGPRSVTEGRSRGHGRPPSGERRRIRPFRGAEPAGERGHADNYYRRPTGNQWRKPQQSFADIDGVVASPQQLAADQIAVDSANLGVSYAEQDLGNAKLVSPISGTIASISVQPGSAVSAASGTPSASDAAIVVLGPGSFIVSTSVDVSNVHSVTVGQTAVVTPDSTNDPLQGTVTSIGLVGTTSDDSTTYPVTIALQQLGGTTAHLGSRGRSGVRHQARDRRDDRPSSAVRAIGTIHVVTRYENGKASTVRVTVGVVGDVLTQIHRAFPLARSSSSPISTKPFPDRIRRRRGRRGPSVAAGSAGADGWCGSGWRRLRRRLRRAGS